MRLWQPLLFGALLVAVAVLGLGIQLGREIAESPPLPPTLDEPPFESPTHPVLPLAIEFSIQRSEPPIAPVPKRRAEVDGYDPDDPSARDDVEFGDCALDIELIDAITGEPVESVVTLWRLGAPASANWSVGDQRIESRKIERSGSRFTDLPMGEYRVVLHAQAATVQDPRPFRIDAPLTRLRQPIVMATPEIAYVELFDETGKRLESGVQVTISQHRKMTPPRAREWTTARSKTSRDSPDAIWTGSGGSGIGKSKRRIPRCEPLGYALGPFAVDSVEWKPRVEIALSVADRQDCHLTLHGSDHVEARRFVGICIPRASVLTHVTYSRELLDSEREQLAKTGLTIEAQAVSRQVAPQSDAWLDVPIRVTLADPRFVEIACSFTLRTGIPEIRIERRSR